MRVTRMYNRQEKFKFETDNGVAIVEDRTEILCAHRAGAGLVAVELIVSLHLVFRVVTYLVSIIHFVRVYLSITTAAQITIQ
jgi:hypothetical protein